MTKSVEIKVHDFDYRLYHALELIKREFSKENARIIKKYDTELTTLIIQRGCFKITSRAAGSIGL